MSYLEETFGAAVERFPLDTLSGAEAMATQDGHLRCWPHKSNTEGFFVARVRKIAAVPPVGGKHADVPWLKKKLDASNSDKHTGNLSSGKEMEKVKSKEVKQLERLFRSFFDCDIPGEDLGCLLRKRSLRHTSGGGEFWLVPKALADLPAVGLRRSGIRLADARLLNLAYAANFEWAISFGHLIDPGSACVANLDVDAAKRFCAGEEFVEPEWDLSAALNQESSQAIVRHGDFVLGMARWENGILRNDTPRHWRCEGIAL